MVQSKISLVGVAVETTGTKHKERKGKKNEYAEKF